MNSKTTIVTAKKIITMNPVRPEANAVAVRDGRILGVGTLEEIRGWGEFTLDESFNDKILIPGLVETHGHVLEGTLWKYPYIGYFKRSGPDGKLWKPCKSIHSIVERLKEIDAQMSDPDQELIAWGLDSIYFKGDRLVAKHLDQISQNRPIYVFHADNHGLTLNSAAMQKHGIGEQIDVEGVVKGEDGKALGELREQQAIALADDFFARMKLMNRDPKSWENYGIQANRAGCTTVTDMAFAGMDDDAVELLHFIIDAPDYPVRVVPLYLVVDPEQRDLEEVAQYVVDLKKQSSEKLRFGLVKTGLDGSIQSATARLRAPGYISSNKNGIWITPPEQIVHTMRPFHRRGITIHCHCNGDEAVDVFINAVEELQSEYCWPDSRHTIQHCQLATIDQYRRMAKSGVCASIFANQLFYWGDQHYSSTVGPDRVQRMEACRTAKQEGIRFSLHSDAPATPLGQLQTAWCAVNRLTATGQTLGEYEKLSVYEALYAVTLDAAYTLGLDHELGSIEPGKCADFTVLQEDPFAIDPIALKDIPVWGTILGGKPFPVQ